MAVVEKAELRVVVAVALVVVVTTVVGVTEVELMVALAVRPAMGGEEQEDLAVEKCSLSICSRTPTGR